MFWFSCAGTNGMAGRKLDSQFPMIDSAFSGRGKKPEGCWLKLSVLRNVREKLLKAACNAGGTLSAVAHPHIKRSQHLQFSASLPSLTMSPPLFAAIVISARRSTYETKIAGHDDHDLRAARRVPRQLRHIRLHEIPRRAFLGD